MTLDVMSQISRVVKIGPHSIGGDSFSVIAGPCSIESREQFESTAKHVLKYGACFLRGGLFKLRTKPESFQGLGREAFQIALEVKTQLAAPFISEVTDPRQISDLYGIVDAFQVGSRNMHNYELLKELGITKKPVILKRGFSGTVKEWLHAAEYITSGGNQNVILCERGIRTFETSTRNTFDLNSVAFLKQNSDFPILGDPSHATGTRNLVAPMSYAALAAGADGIMVEVHPDPAAARSDGFQALTFDDFKEMMLKINKMLPIFNKNFERTLEL